MSSKILIISNKGDITTDFVIKRLHERQIEFIRFNTEDFPSLITSSISIGENHPRLILRSSRWRIGLEGVRSIWYRRPKLADLEDLVTDSSDRTFALREVSEYLQNIWALLNDKTWVNNPYRIRLAENKIHQLYIASVVGLTIPDSIVSNDPIELDRFYNRHNGEVIVKPISHGGFGDNDEYGIYATYLPHKQNLPSLETAKYSPLIMQNMINKASDVRVTVMKDQMFAYSINAEDGSAADDWRKLRQEELRYKRIEVPAGISEKILEFLRRYDLLFGAFDFALTKAGDWVFLEVNPSGQWAWLEIITGDPMSDALVDVLCE